MREHSERKERTGTVVPALAATHASTVTARWLSRVRRLAVETMLVLGALQAYRFVRIVARGTHDTAIQNGVAILRLERTLGIDVERSTQSAVLGSRFVVDLFNTIYVWGFWSVVAATLLLLFVIDRRQFRLFRNALFLSGSLGLVVFAVFPVAPPRMLAGFVDTVHLYSDAASIARPGSFTNEYAAMPSFHVGWLVLAGAAIMPALSRRGLRLLSFLPAGVMSVTVVVTANHYLLDAVAGSLVALTGLVAAQRLPPVDSWWVLIQLHLEPRGGVSAVIAKAGVSVGAGLVPFVGARAAYVAHAAGGQIGRAPTSSSRHPRRQLERSARVSHDDARRRVIDPAGGSRE